MKKSNDLKTKGSTNGDGLNFEAQLWAAADKMRGHMDASEYKHVCLGLIFLKYISDAFENQEDRDRRGETLFIDARKMGVLIDRIHRELTVAEIKKISDTYHAWRSKSLNSQPSTENSYADVAGFCKSVKLEEIRTHDYVLTPGRYVGVAEVEDDGEPFDQKMKRLAALRDALLPKLLSGELRVPAAAQLTEACA